VNIGKPITWCSIFALGLVSGCLNFKPAIDTTRFYVLMPLVAPTPGGAACDQALAVGISRIDLPEYLQQKRIVFRKGQSQIQYCESSHWAERLDKGIQRVLGANIASLLGSTNVVLSAWRRSEVQAEVYVSVQRFESDEQGWVVLEAQWRITNPGAEETGRSDFSKIIKQGPAPGTDPGGAVAALSNALADLSREIGGNLRGLRQTCPRNAE
jgi:uncharacterized lipoprotein YmbA